MFSVLVLGLGAVQARDLRVGVDPEYPTIAAAIAAAQAGDTIHLEPKVYRESAVFNKKMGEAGQPITLDGHGAILEGVDPLDPAEWQEVAPGLFASETLMPRFATSMLSRWFFLWDGVVNRMGRSSKGKGEPLKAPEDLKPREWTYVIDPSTRQPDSRQITGRFYLKLAPGEALAEASIFAPVRSAGVALSGENAHLVIRNITARHPHNDGFNIHGHCHDVLFENIAALGCGDDGISAHETAQYHVKGLVSIGNSNGICDIGKSETSYEQVFIADCLSYDLYFLDEGRFSLKDVLVYSSAQQGFVLTGKESGSQLRMDNVYLRRLVEPRVGEVRALSTLTATRTTFEGLEIKITGTATFEDCLVEGQPSSAGAKGADLEALSALIPKTYQP